MARVDLLVRKREFQLAADELGRVSKDFQNDPLFQRYADRVLAQLYGPRARRAQASPLAAQDYILQRLRVTRRKHDANPRSDQSFDNRGWQVNERLEADTEGKDGIRARFTLDLDGFRNGHNDLRYRTVLADFYDGPSHLGLGDSATYPSPFFMRGSRVRGLNLILSGQVHELQAVAGGYPYWLEARDEYIYPRTVLGLRDRWKLWEDRVRLAANVITTRDSEKIRTIDVANKVRDNTVWSLDQEVKLIPDVWYLKAAEAYSYTDEGLLNERFDRPLKLKDTSFRVESLLIRPWARWTGRFERTGPDFRLLTDLPSGSVLNVKGITADRQLAEQFVDLEPLGPFDLDLEASWMRNNLDEDDNVEQTRISWYTANLGLLVPYGWPRPRFRGSIIDTVSVPGSATRPSQTRTYSLHTELSHYLEGIHFSEFADYQGEFPMRDRSLFDREVRYSLGARAAAAVLENILVSPHYTWRLTNESFDEDRTGAVEHETGISTSLGLWSTASLGLSYDYLHGKLADPAGSKLIHSEGHTGTVNFSWPYTVRSWNKRRRLTLFPGLTAHFSSFRHNQELRPLVSSRLAVSYEVFQDWKAEMVGEFLWDQDKKDSRIRTEESRIWLLWTSRWK